MRLMNKIKNGDMIYRFIFKERIGKGGFGSVYKCAIAGSNNQEFAALKVVSNQDSKSIENEKKILENIQSGCPYFPRLLDAAQCSSFYYIAMEYLGPSLEEINRRMNDIKFNDYTLAYIAVQTLKCIKELHSFGIIHRDIKPSNFLLRNDGKSVCLIDFGLSTHYIFNNRHILSESSKGVGTVDFQSLAAHRGTTLSRRDDMESWVYSILYLHDHTLPWAELDANEVFYKKKSSGKQLAAEFPPFNTIYNDIINLKFMEEPHYEKYERLLYKLVSKIPEDKQVLNLDEYKDKNASCCNIF